MPKKLTWTCSNPASKWLYGSVFDKLWTNTILHLANSFLILKCPCKILKTSSSDMFTILRYLKYLHSAVVQYNITDFILRFFSWPHSDMPDAQHHSCLYDHNKIQWTILCSPHKMSVSLTHLLLLVCLCAQGYLYYVLRMQRCAKCTHVNLEGNHAAICWIKLE